MAASAENEQTFSLSHTERLRTQEKDLSPKYFLQPITTKCPMLLWSHDEKTSESVTAAGKATLDKKEFLKPDTYVKSRTKPWPVLSSMKFLLVGHSSQKRVRRKGFSSHSAITLNSEDRPGPGINVLYQKQNTDHESDGSKD